MPAGDEACEHLTSAACLQRCSPRLLVCGRCAEIVPLPPADGAGVLPPARVHAAPGGILRGKYRLIRKLGEGAHGVSYLAEHVYLSHPCVVKLLPHRVADATDAAVQRLRSAARAGFRVNDVNVVRVLDCDVVRGQWYFVMEYVEGADLGEVIRAGVRLSWQQALQIAVDAAGGLTAIHRCKLVHRDIKPSNLLLGTDGRVRVADLGVAGFAHDRTDPHPASAAEQVGTLAYSAPELFEPGAPVGPRADLYSLGATLYHLVTGRLPHSGGTVFQRLIDLSCRAATWPADLSTNPPAWFIDAVMRLLEIDPRQRFESARQFVEHLKPPAVEAVPPSAAPVAETLEPRGIGVLPFENERQDPHDDWLGYALANYVSRALAELPGVYVADQDGLVGVLARLDAPSAQSGAERLRTAGRMVGAGTVVTGRFARDGGALRVIAEVCRAESAAAQTAARVEGSLADLAELEKKLLSRLVRVLHLGPVGQDTPHPARSSVLEAREKLVLGRQEFLRGNYEQAIDLAQEAVALDPQFAEAMGFMGVCYARVGNYEAAETQHHRQEHLAKEWDDGRLETEALANLGVMHYFRGDYEAAQCHYERAAARAGRLGLAVEEAQICNNLGFVLLRRGLLAEAEAAFHRAIATHRTYGGLTSLVGPYNGMGNVLVEQKRYSEARTYYRRALALAEEVGDRTSVGTTHMHLGRCAAVEQRFAEAKHEFTMSLNALEETRFWNGLARAYEYIAEMNMQLGDFDEAIRCADKRIELARQHTNARMEQAAWAQKAESLQRAGRTAEAAACLAKGRDAQPG